MLRDHSFATRADTGAIDRVVAIAAAHASAVDRDGRFPTEAVAALKAEGLLGAMVPTRLGGGGASLATLTGYAQRLGTACASTAMVFAMHQNQVACILQHALDQDWHRDFARRLASEQLLLASITSEVGIGGDMRSSLCAIAVEQGRFALTKQASTMSYGAQADGYLVTARAHRDAPASDQVLVTALREDCTLEQTGGWDAMGMRGTGSGAFAFTGSGVADQVLPAGFAEIAADTMVPVSHLLWGGVWTGIAVDAVGRARAFLRAQARAKPNVVLPGAARLMQATGMLELMQARLKGMLDAYDACHGLGDEDRILLTPQAAGWLSGMGLATALNTLKHDISEMCHEAVVQAMLVCGMSGYRNDTPYSVGRHLRDILSARLMISNDRIAANTGMLLLAQRSSLGTL